MRVAICVVILALLAPAACEPEESSTFPTPGGTGRDAATERVVGVYSAVIRQLVTKDHTFGQDPGFGVIYVTDHAVENAAHPIRNETERDLSKPFSEEVRSGIVQELEDLPPIEFVSDGDSVVGSPAKGSQVESHGAIVTLGPVPGGVKKVKVGASLYIANLAATWLTYVVRGSATGWRVTGTTGPVAIS